MNSRYSVLLISIDFFNTFFWSAGKTCTINVRMKSMTQQFKLKYCTGLSLNLIKFWFCVMSSSFTSQICCSATHSSHEFYHYMAEVLWFLPPQTEAIMSCSSVSQSSNEHLIYESELSWLPPQQVTALMSFFSTRQNSYQHLLYNHSSQEFLLNMSEPSSTSRALMSSYFAKRSSSSTSRTFMSSPSTRDIFHELPLY